LPILRDNFQLLQKADETSAIIICRRDARRRSDSNRWANLALAGVASKNQRVVVVARAKTLRHLGNNPQPRCERIGGKTPPDAILSS